MRDELRRDLREAMKQNATAAVRAIRSLLAAIDNAEAVPLAQTSDSGAHIANATVGAGSGDRPRRELTQADLDRVLAAELIELANARQEYLRTGRQDEARKLEEQIEVLSRYAPGPR